MKKNLLFIHTFWLFLAAFVGTFIYVAANDVDGIYLFHSSSAFFKTFWLPAVIAIASLVIAVPLGLCPKDKSAKKECALLHILIVIALLAIVEMLSVGNKLSNVSDVFGQVYHYFMLFGVVIYLSILLIVCILKVMYTIIFKNNESNDKYASQIAVTLTSALFLGGFLTLFFSAVSFVNKGTISSLGEYINLVDKCVLIIVIDVCVVMLMAHLIASNFTKKGILPLIVDFVGLVCGIVLACLIKTDVIKLNEDLTYLFELAKFIIGAYLFALAILVLSYAITPFVKYIGSNKTYLDEEDKEKENDETTEEQVEDALEEVKEEEPSNETEAVEETEVETEKEEVEETEESSDKENEEISSLREELAKANDEISELNKKLDNHIASDVHIDTNNNSQTIFTTENLSDKSHYETELKTTITRGFKAKLLVADDSLKQTYSDLLNIPFKYKRGNVRSAFAKTTLVLGRTKVAVLKMSPSSKAMYLYLNLPASYLEISKYHLKDYSTKTKSLATTPYRLRIKSDRSMKYALELLEAAYNELGAVPFKLPRPKKDFTEELGPQTEDQMIENGLIKKKVVEETYLVEPIFAEEDINKDTNQELNKKNVVNDEEIDDEEIDDDVEDNDENEESEEE